MPTVTTSRLSLSLSLTTRAPARRGGSGPETQTLKLAQNTHQTSSPLPERQIIGGAGSSRRA